MPPQPQASSAPITSLGRRLPAFRWSRPYEKAHPSVKLDIVACDGGANGDGSIESKVALVQPGRPRLAGHHLLRGGKRRPKARRRRRLQFPGRAQQGPRPQLDHQRITRTGALAPCMVGGKLECLRNDLAFDVLWVNVPLMHQWGYSRPHRPGSSGRRSARTWPRTTPATSSAPLGDSFDDSIYLQAAQCPVNDKLNQYTVLDNPNDPHCTGMGALLDPLLKDGAVPTTYVFCQHLRRRSTPARC